MNVTKFDQLTKFLARKKVFRYGDVNKHFKRPVSELNTYTTYLNLLRHEGLVEQTGHGRYKVPDIASMKAITLSKVLLSLRLKKAIKDREELEGTLKATIRESNLNYEAAASWKEQALDLQQKFYDAESDLKEALRGRVSDRIEYEDKILGLTSGNRFVQAWRALWRRS